MIAIIVIVSKGEKKWKNYHGYRSDCKLEGREIERLS